VVEVVLLPDRHSLHVVHVHFHRQSVVALLLVDHLLSHPEELSVIVTRLVELGVVHKLHLREINTVVVGLQDLLEHGAQVRVVEDVTIVVHRKAVPVHTKLVRRDQLLNFCDWNVRPCHSQKFCNADLPKRVCYFIWL